MIEITHENLVAEIGKLYDQVTKLQAENEKLRKVAEAAKAIDDYLKIHYWERDQYPHALQSNSMLHRKLKKALEREEK